MWTAIALIGAAIIGAGVTLWATSEQQETLEKGQEESRKLAEQQRTDVLDQSEKNLALNKRQLKQQAKQFNEQMEFKKEARAYDRFQGQFNRLASLLSQNENLKSLYTNKIKSLGRTA